MSAASHPGPEVNDHLETSVPGVFACGNVLQVHDLDVTCLRNRLWLDRRRRLGEEHGRT